MLERHRARFQDKALDISLLSSPRLVFLAGETYRDDLGLAADVLKEVSLCSYRLQVDGLIVIFSYANT
jgi:hypothetical protein